MDVRVLLHVGLLVKPFAAELARVRPGVRVDQQVRGQRGRPFKRFSAQLALKNKTGSVYTRIARVGCNAGNNNNNNALGGVGVAARTPSVWASKTAPRTLDEKKVASRNVFVRFECKNRLRRATYRNVFTRHDRPRSTTDPGI